MKKKTKQYTFGGVLKGLSPLLGAVNPALGAGAGILGGIMNQPGAPDNGLPRQDISNPYGMNLGGYYNGGTLDPISQDTVKVNGNNPALTDGVRIPGARVDNNETISPTSTGTYVFSDDLKIPGTNTSFAKANERIAKSDNKAQNKVQRHLDKESQNTLSVNTMLRDFLAQTNENIRLVKQVANSETFNVPGESSKSKSSDKYYERAKGGYLNYNNGGPIEPLPTYGITPPTPGLLGQHFLTDVPETLTNYGITPPTQGLTGSNTFVNGVPNQLPGSYGTVTSMNPKDPPQVNTTKKPQPNYPFPTGPALQGLEALINGATLLRGIEREPRYTNTSPINLRQYNPNPALLRNQNIFEGIRRGLNNSSSEGTRNANLQQAYANKYNADSNILQQYTERNLAARDNYEQRLGQRQAENIRNQQYTNQVNSQNEAAFFNGLRAVAGSVGNLGRSMVDRDINQASLRLLGEAYPDLKEFMDYSALDFYGREAKRKRRRKKKNK